MDLEQLVAASNAVVIVFGDHKVPSVEAIFAAIGNYIARFPDSVFGRIRQ